MQSKCMFVVVIWVYCGLPKNKGMPKILQLSILGTQFLNPGKDLAGRIWL